MMPIIPRFNFEKFDPKKVYNLLHVNDTFYNGMPSNYCQLNQEQMNFVNALIEKAEEEFQKQIQDYHDTLTCMEQDLDNDY